jgi:hypothetical protein
MMKPPVENINSTRVVKAPFHMFTVRAAGKDGNVGGEIGGMGMPDPAVDPGGVHVQRVGVAQRLGRQRTKALLLVPYAVVLLAMNGVPRSLMEVSKASLTNKGEGEARVSPLDHYSAGRTPRYRWMWPRMRPLHLGEQEDELDVDAGGGREVMTIRVGGPVRESQRLGVEDEETDPSGLRMATRWCLARTWRW